MQPTPDSRLNGVIVETLAKHPTLLAQSRIRRVIDANKELACELLKKQVTELGVKWN